MRSDVRFVLAYLRLNLSAAVGYRAAFLAQALGMMLNDLVFIIFWGLYFARFPNVGGWGIQDVALLWAVAATSIGLSAALVALASGGCVLAALSLATPRVRAGELAGVLLAVVVLTPLAVFEAVAPLPLAAQQLGAARSALRRVFALLDQGSRKAEHAA